MNFLFFIFILITLFGLFESQVHQCPNYQELHVRKRTQKPNEEPPTQNLLNCNFKMINPKRVINNYKENIKNFVQAKPFGSLCLKCSICLTIANEMKTVLNHVSEVVKDKNNAYVLHTLQENMKDLCATGFDNYDLRKFKEYQALTNDFTDNKHVRTQMDGRWTEKLREMCKAYLSYMDIQILFDDYLEGNNLSSYLCSTNGIFRDCSSLDLNNSSQQLEGKC